MRAAVFLLNRARAEIVPMLILALVVAVTAFLAAAAPRLFTRVADDGLRYHVGRAQSVERNLELGRIGHISGGTALEAVADLGSQLEAELSPSVRRLVRGSTYHAESANWSIHDPPTGQPSWLRFRFPAGVEERIAYVDGRAPTGNTTTIPGRRGTLPGEPEDATVFEVALSTEIADALGVVVGDRLELVPDTEDVLVGQFSSPVRAAADVVGLYTVQDPDDEFWLDDSSLQLPTVVIISPNLRLLYGTALLSADAYPTLIGNGLAARYRWRQFIDPARLDAGALDQLTADLRRMQTRYPPFVTTQHDPDITTLQTGLLNLLDRYAGERRTAEAVLVTASLGPASVAASAVALVALLMVHRRRRALTLVRGRGGSGAQLLASHLVEGLVIAVPSAGVAYLGAISLVQARPTVWSPILAVIVAGGAALVLVLTVLRPAWGSIRDSQRVAATATRASPRRIAFEALVVILAVGGAYLLRERGLAGGSTAGQLGRVDPLLAAVPALIGLAVGLLTVRLYPLPLRLAGWFADGWRGMVPALGLRRAARTGDLGSLPLIVLLVTVAIGAFSSTIFITVERGQAAAAWHQVGADLAIAPTRPLPADFDPETLPGVEAAAEMHVDVATLDGRGGPRVEMHALDTPAYVAVTAGTEADPDLPRGLRDPPSAGEPIPTIVSTAVATGGPRPVRVGDEVEMLVSARTVNLRIVEVRESFPGVEASAAWLVVPLHSLRTEVPDRAFTPSVVFLRAPDGSRDEVQLAIDAVLPATPVESRAEALDALRAGPLVRGVGIGFVLAVIVAVAYAALATTAALVLVAAVRSRETAHLGTLGMTPRGLLALALVEHGPAVLAATIIGVALGIGIAWFVTPGLDLAALIGSPIAVILVVDWRVVGLLLVALVILLAVGIVLSTWIGRRASLAGATRQGIE